MSVLAEKIRLSAADLEQIAEILESLEQERDYYKGQATKWASVVDRQGLNYAERVQLEEFERRAS